ncbi:MAG: hypothetical protein ACK502_10695 [Alphaproteobacteria bacterium]|jgi:hypothetical protein
MQTQAIATQNKEAAATTGDLFLEALNRITAAQISAQAVSKPSRSAFSTGGGCMVREWA